MGTFAMELTLDRFNSADHAAHPEERDPQCEVVAAFVATLPYAQRVALVLRQIHNLGYAEIAAMLRCSEDEARASVYDALRSLRDHVGGRSCAGMQYPGLASHSPPPESDTSSSRSCPIDP